MSDKLIANEIMDYVEWESGSKQWPSDNPKDSPCDKFICRLCGWNFFEQMYGSFPVEVKPIDKVKKRFLEHLAVRHKIKIPLEIKVINRRIYHE